MCIASLAFKTSALSSFGENNGKSKFMNKGREDGKKDERKKGNKEARK